MARIASKIKQDPQFQALVAALGSEEQAKLAFDGIRQASAEPKLAVVTPLSSKQRAEALVEKQGFEYAKGRVYAGPVLAEAIVRVHKTGKPEIVASSGVGRTKAVLVYKEDSGDVALQNLTRD